MIYKSKVDLWLLLVLILTTGAPLVFSIAKGPHWAGVAICLPLMAFVGYTVLTIRYTIREGNLYIRGGFSKFDPIPVAAIRRIEATRSLLASPAASLDRLEIFYNRYDSVIVSPKDKSGFINGLTLINPEIVVGLENRKAQD